MGAKRANTGLWKIDTQEGEPAANRIGIVLGAYEELHKEDPGRYTPFRSISLAHSIPDVELSLYVRRRASRGMLPFLGDYLASADKESLTFQSVDACLFVATESSLFAVTSGNGYRLIEEYVDYGFPFDVAKKLIANRFRAAEIREFAGPRTNISETYRQDYSIGKSESWDKVWKKLVGPLDRARLPDGSPLREIIDISKTAPTIEVRTSFTLRKSLDLPQLVTLAQGLDRLPEPSPEKARELSFLENLHPVRGKQVIDSLLEALIEDIRNAVLTGEYIDLDVCDPDDSVGYYSGSGFKLLRKDLGHDPPQQDDIVLVLREKCARVLGDSELFRKKVASANLHYNAGADDSSPPIRKALWKFFHGHVEHQGRTYFLVDKVWYQSVGSFLDNLKEDFIEETFAQENGILITTDFGLIPWEKFDEGAFNREQSRVDGFHFGDRIFAKSDRGRVELFDLLKIEAETTYVIHAKDGFDARMREACSQIKISADVIRRDLNTGREVLEDYYEDWTKSEQNSSSGVTKSDFLSWFDRGRRIVYVVLVGTRAPFVRESFERNELHSHIARREVITTHHELQARRGDTFRIVRTPRVDKNPEITTVVNGR